MEKNKNVFFKNKRNLFVIAIIVGIIIYSGSSYFITHKTAEQIMKQNIAERKDIEISHFLFLEIPETKGALLLGKIKDSESYTKHYGHALLPSLHRYHFVESTDVERSEMLNSQSKSLFGAGASVVEKDGELYLQTAQGEQIPFIKKEVEK